MCNRVVCKTERVRCAGFTLVELMLASVLGVIIIMSVGSVMVATWRQSSEFIEESLTMQDVNLIAEIFKKHVRSDTISHAIGLTNELVFTMSDGSGTARLYHDQVTDSLYYEKNGNTVMSFKGMVLNFDTDILGSSAASARSLYTLTIEVYEAELNKTNSFEYRTTSRVEFDK